MISVAASSKAKNWCMADSEDFGSIERRCLGYLRVAETVVGPFPNQSTRDHVFLTLVRTELEQGDPHDDAFRRHHNVWANA